MIRTLSQVLADSDLAPPPARAFFYNEIRLRAYLRLQYDNGREHDDGI